MRGHRALARAYWDFVIGRSTLIAHGSLLTAHSSNVSHAVDALVTGTDTVTDVTVGLTSWTGGDRSSEVDGTGSTPWQVRNVRTAIAEFARMRTVVAELARVQTVVAELARVQTVVAELARVQTVVAEAI